MTSSFRTLARAVVLAIVLVAPAAAEDVKVGDLVITGAWSRATPGGAKVAGGYLTIENKGAAADRLIIESPTNSGMIMLRALAPEPGLMSMARSALAGAQCRLQQD